MQIYRKGYKVRLQGSMHFLLLTFIVSFLTCPQRPVEMKKQF